MSNVVWSPQPKQAIFMSRPEYECLYGGSAGGGKSDSLIIEALRQVHHPNYTGIILRKTYPQLTELIDKSQNYYKQLFPDANYNGTGHCWTFPSGAKIYFGSMNHSSDKINYQGKSYCFVGFDELTHFTWDEYSYLFSRCRPNAKGLRCYVRATTNPGGIGHGWVKERFITAAPPMTTIWTKSDVYDNTGRKMTMWRDRIFVPATVFDNQELLKNDPNYLASLSLLPEADRNALLYGSWDSFEGQVFNEWRNDSSHYDDRMYTHVINPFRIPKEWKVFRCLDWGYSRPFACYWIAVDYNKKKYVIREYYGCTGEPNKGVQLNPVDVAENIREIENTDDNLKGKKITGVADPAIFSSDGGISIADSMARHPNCVLWDKGDHARIPGKMQVHYHLALDDDGYPMLQIFNTCKHLIRTLPALVYDEKNVEDVDSDGEDHAYDAIRYGLMANKITPRGNKMLKEYDGFDPLNQRTGADNRDTIIFNHL